MNKNILIFLAALGGAAAGVAGTYFYMKKKCDETIDTEVKKFKEDYSNRHKKPYFEELASGEIRDKGELENDGKPLMESKSSLSNKPVEVEKIPYHKVVANYTKGDISDILAESEAPDDDEEDPGVVEVERTGDDILLITSDEWLENENYAEVSLMWYIEPDELTDEYDEEVMDRAPLVGSILESVREEILNKAEEIEEDLAVYIRNDKLEAMYEVEVIFGERM